jgi:methionyl-tRNA formyltransferase
MEPRIVFMGSPEFALPSLSALVRRYPVVGVITQPDRPAGRGRSLTPPPIKVLAEALALPIIQPSRLRAPEAMQQLIDWAPDLIVVAAFGQILRPAVLDLPALGCINVHASLLPRWRGAAPIAAAIRAGDPQTGVSIMKMDPGIDTGPWLAQRVESIRPDDTAHSLGERLAQVGSDLLLETLPDWIAGRANLHSQDDSLAVYAPMLKKEHGLADFTRPAAEIERCVRAFIPWPGVYTLIDGQVLKILRAHVAPTPVEAKPGAPVIIAGLPAFVCAQEALVLDEVQPAGKKPMSAKVFLQGARDWGTA